MNGSAMTGCFLSALAGILTIGLAVVSLPSCNSSGCTDNHSAIPQAGFYDASSHHKISIKGIELGGVGAPGDSLLVTSDESVATINLPFSHIRQEVAFFLRTVDTSDTITFRYSSREFFASEECGAMFLYAVKNWDYTHNLVDSVAVTDTLITNVDRERIQIYLKVKGEEP